MSSTSTNTQQQQDCSTASASGSGNPKSAKSNNFKQPYILQHFDVDQNDPQKFMCKLCVKTTHVACSGSTGNLHKHLKRKHSATYDALVKQQKLSNSSPSQAKATKPVHKNPTKEP
uniref:BED-type domain-containing protein n=1 Tax=Cacopsylla melanoneura TaxID=428564 RepID=A0A8D8QMG3_9HEMI